MPSRVVKPETKLLNISGDDWLLVKRRLNHGEQSRYFLRGFDAEGKPAPVKRALAKIAVYLLDWSLTDPSGTPIAVRGASLGTIEAALESFDSASVLEIHTAIEAHEDAVEAELALEKKTLAIAIKSDPISPSLEPADGGMSGSPSSIPMSTAS